MLILFLKQILSSSLYYTIMHQVALLWIKVVVVITGIPRHSHPRKKWIISKSHPISRASQVLRTLDIG